MRATKRERQLILERDRWNAQCKARAEAIAGQQPVYTSLTNPKVHGGGMKRQWDWNSSKARSVAQTAKGRSVK